MTEFINRPHSNHVFLTSVALSAAELSSPNPVLIPLETNVMFERFIYRITPKMSHGDVKPKDPKYGGLYNLIQSASIRKNSNNEDVSFKMRAIDLYNDCFARTGREKNDFDYFNPPAEFTQNVQHCFSGRGHSVNNLAADDNLFGLDLRHTSAGVNTFNKVEIMMETGTLENVYHDVGDSVLDELTIEVFGVQMFHTQDSKTVYRLSGTSRYGEINSSHDDRRITDTSLTQVFNIEPVGTAQDNANLSDIIVTQLDDKGQPIAFNDENKKVIIKVGQFDYFSAPIWAIREDQNGQRIQPVPDNVLIIRPVMVGGLFAGLSNNELGVGAALCIDANGADGEEDSVPSLFLQKSYTRKLG